MPVSNHEPSSHSATAENQAHLTTPSNESGFREGLRDAGMMFLGFITMGAGLGVLVTSVGLPWWVSPILSGMIYAGSVEFLLVGMIATTAPLSLIASTTLLINARHLVYGISFPLKNVKSPLGKFISMYMLSDEAYALNTGPRSHTYRSSRILTVSIGLWASWVLGSTLGAILGASFLSHLKGVDFVMTGMFIILSIDSYRSVKDNWTAIAAVFSAIVALLLAQESMLLIALLTLVALLVIRYFVEKKKAEGENTHA